MFPAFQIAPPLPFIPESDHGKTFVLAVCCWAGAPERAEEIFAPIRGVAPLVAEMVASMPYPARRWGERPPRPRGVVSRY
jgi:hypothetical protein